MCKISVASILQLMSAPNVHFKVKHVFSQEFIQIYFYSRKKKFKKLNKQIHKLFFFFTLKDSYGFIFLLKVLNYLEKLTYIIRRKSWLSVDLKLDNISDFLLYCNFNSLRLSVCLSHTHILCLLQIIIIDHVIGKETRRYAYALSSLVRSKGLQNFMVISTSVTGEQV